MGAGENSISKKQIIIIKDLLYTDLEKNIYETLTDRRTLLATDRLSKKREESFINDSKKWILSNINEKSPHCKPII